MDPVVQSALIGTVATIVSVGGTVAVAYMGFRFSRSSNQAAIDATHADVVRTLDATREGQLADRYTKAIEQLGSETIDVTIGGIFALERIALDSPRDHSTVMEVLAAFIREHSREQWSPTFGKEPDAEPPERTTRPDIQAALTVIGRRDAAHDRQPINLAHANLTRAELNRANLTGVDLTDADLTGVRLGGANLTGATLNGANLTAAFLSTAVLTEAEFNRANLNYASLFDANLCGAGLQQADLTGTQLSGADLSGANLTAANLASANLKDVILANASLRHTDLTTVMWLDGANLSSANLTGAIWPRDRAAPEGWAQDPESGQLLPPKDSSHD